MISVGVNEDVVLSKVELNEKGTLTISVKEKGTEVAEKKEVSVIDQLSEGSDTSGDSNLGETTFLMFMPSLVKYEKDENGGEVPEEADKVLQNFIEFKNQLVHILKRFVPSTAIKFAPFAGLPVNAADINDVKAKIVIKATAEKVYTNYCNAFISQITPFLNNETKLSRLFLHRRSKESHFGVLRKKFLENQPFWESSDISIDASKMFTKQTDTTTAHFPPIEVNGVMYVPNFSSYEVKKGLDNPNKIEVEEDAVNTRVEEDIKNAQMLFSGAGAQAPNFQVEE